MYVCISAALSSYASLSCKYKRSYIPFLKHKPFLARVAVMDLGLP